MGEDAPTEANLLDFMASRPHCTYYTGQRPRPKRTAAASFVDLCTSVPAKVARMALGA